jgi:hypothetical protein
MTNDNSLTYFPLCINDFHALVLVIKKIKMNEREGFLKYIFYAFFIRLVMQLSYHVLNN